MGRKILKKILFLLASAILKRYEPKVVGITGSVGKTSTKEAIYAVLASKLKVRRNIKNYNNEIGLPLTIIGAGSGGRSLISWAKVFIKAVSLMIFKDKNYPDILVLEMGVDRKGDMKYLTDLVNCYVGVVTNIGPVHLEHFGTLERIAKEKAIVISHIDRNGWAVLNNDNQYTESMVSLAKGRCLTYGIKNEADIKAVEVSLSHGELGGLSGLSFKMIYNGSAVPVLLPNILGEHLVYAALAASAIGIIFEMNMVEIATALKQFKAPSGRMNLISGIKGTYIIDDTYNASPDSMAAAVDVLGRIETETYKYAVLGDMLELGDFTREGHELVGKKIVENKIDYLITVGDRAAIIADKALSLGMNRDRVFTFSDREEAGIFVQGRINKGDYILVKGSQGARMEKIVKEIMAEPLRAEELLVRFDKFWQGK